VAGLQFVISPIAARDGRPLRQVDGRYTASVFPFLSGRSHPFGPYTDARLRNRVLDMIVVLHQATPAVRDGAPRHVLGFAGQDDLEAFLLSPDQPWDSGPYAEAARSLLLPHAADLGQIVTTFDRLAKATRPNAATQPPRCQRSPSGQASHSTPSTPRPAASPSLPAC
jgi:hypothetical protein